MPRVHCSKIFDQQQLQQWNQQQWQLIATHEEVANPQQQSQIIQQPQQKAQIQELKMV